MKNWLFWSLIIIIASFGLLHMWLAAIFTFVVLIMLEEYEDRDDE